ncbi:unnamed protein product, partial [Lymnaea stagnalis]
DGQVYVLSANGQQLILQSSANSANASSSQQVKNISSHISTTANSAITNISIPSNGQLQFKGQTQQLVNQSNLNLNTNVSGQLKFNSQTIPLSVQSNNTFSNANSQADNRIYIKTGQDGSSALTIQSSSQSVTAAQLVFTSSPTYTYSPGSVAQSTMSQQVASPNQMHSVQVKNQKITTLSGTFIKQEPLAVAIKQEPSTELQSTIPLSQTPQCFSISPQTSVTVTTSNTLAMTMPPVVSSFAAITTSTTQSHQSTIMTTAQMAGTLPTSVTSINTQLPHSSISDSSAVLASAMINQALPSPTLLTPTTPTGTRSGSVS